MSEVVIVTGGRGKIGKTIVQELQKHKYEVISLDIQKITQDSQEEECISIDLCDETLVTECICSLFQKKKKRIRAWIHAAGTMSFAKIENLSWENLKRDYENTIKPILNVIQAINMCCSKSYVRKDFNIVLIASLFGIEVAQGLSSYGMSKAAVINFGKSIALEFGKKGIRTNCISPGLLRTGIAKTYIEEIYQENISSACKFQNLPDSFVKLKDIAKLVVDLTENQSMNGSNIIIDQGYSLL